MILGVTLEWAGISSRGSRNTPSRFMLQEPELRSGLMGDWARTRALCFNTFIRLLSVLDALSVPNSNQLGWADCDVPRVSTHLFILSLFWQLVQPDEEFSFQQFLNPANKYKNRYANIVACRLFVFTLFLHDLEFLFLLLLLLLLSYRLTIGT